VMLNIITSENKGMYQFTFNGVIDTLTEQEWQDLIRFINGGRK